MPYDPDALEPCCHESHPYTELAARIRQDPEYAWSWHCVAACAALDEHIDHDTANRIASRVMRTMFDVETQHPECSQAEGGRCHPAKLAQLSLSPRSIWQHLKDR